MFEEKDLDYLRIVEHKILKFTRKIYSHMDVKNRKKHMDTNWVQDSTPIKTIRFSGTRRLIPKRHELSVFTFHVTFYRQAVTTTTLRIKYSHIIKSNVGESV